MNEMHFAILRRHMVEVIGIHTDLIEEELGNAVLDERILRVMLRIPRHLLMPEPFADVAYPDMPLPIGFNKTISQPLMCVLMTDLLAPEQHETVLEVGTGLGYQTGVLAELAGHVWSVEVVEEFADSARERLAQPDYKNVGIRIGDGSRGWPAHAPTTRSSLRPRPRRCRVRCSNSLGQLDASSCRWAERLRNSLQR